MTPAEYGRAGRGWTGFFDEIAAELAAARCRALARPPAGARPPCGPRPQGEPRGAGERYEGEQLLDREAGDVGERQALAPYWSCLRHHW